MAYEEGNYPLLGEITANGSEDARSHAIIIIIKLIEINTKESLKIAAIILKHGLPDAFCLEKLLNIISKEEERLISLYIGKYGIRLWSDGYFFRNVRKIFFNEYGNTF